VRALPCAVALLLVGCAGDPLDVELAEGPAILTDASTYTLVWRDHVLEVAIPFTFENRLPQPVYLQRCAGVLPPSLETKVDGEWRKAWSAPDYCASSIPLQLAAGQRYSDTLRVYAHPFGDEREPQFATPEVGGIHRLQWDRVLRSFDVHALPPGDLVPLRHRVSNEFRLEAP
jgi:hypothetical protein